MTESFEDDVRRKTQRLASRPYDEIAREIHAKRLAWLRSRSWPSSPTPRQAFDALFLDYLGLDPRELVVTGEGANAIHWQARNPCVTLAACETLGLRTAIVCRQISDKPTQGFLSYLDPRLRFVRDYAQLRPDSPFCAESIVRVDLDACMRVAIDEARLSIDEGNKGYGAVVMWGDTLLARAHDTATSEKDPIAHAEVNAVRQAVRALGQDDLCGALLVSTCEPCPMCSSLAVWANLSGVAFGASIADTARLGKRRIMVPVAEIAHCAPTWLEVIPGILGGECLELYA
jgi:tRNA(Arg) A34 adenosine deaminase TadA